MARFPLPAVFGIPLRTSWSWIIVALCLTAISFYQIAPESADRLELAGWVFGAVVLVVGSVASILIHDYGHIRAARRAGSDLTALEPSLLGALPDTCYPPENPAQELRIALAGPLVSLALAAAFLITWLLAGRPDSLPGGAILLLAAFNGLLAALGFLPGYPFDGGRLFRAFVWYLTDDLVRATRIAGTYGQALLFLGLLAGVVLLSMGETNSVWGTWVLVICWTINRARSEGIAQTAWREAGKELRIDDLFQAGVNRVPASATVDDSIESLLDNFRRGPTLVVDGNEVVGVVELSAVRKVPRASWTQVTVREIMTELDGLTRLESSDPVTKLLAEFPAPSSRIVLVQRGGKIVAAADRDFTHERVEAYIRAERFNRRRRQ